VQFDCHKHSNATEFSVRLKILSWRSHTIDLQNHLKSMRTFRWDFLFDKFLQSWKCILLIKINVTSICTRCHQRHPPLSHPRRGAFLQCFHMKLLCKRNRSRKVQRLHPLQKVKNEISEHRTANVAKKRFWIWKFAFVTLSQFIRRQKIKISSF